MAISFNKSRGADDTLMSDINTTPLVDVMLVLLIIFLITIPAVNSTVQIKLPKETINISEAKVDTVVISVDAAGLKYWGNDKLDTRDGQSKRFEALRAMPVKPEVHIRGDASADYKAIGEVVYALQAVGVTRIGFITQQPPKN